MIKPFKDKYTKVIYQPGQEIEMTQERYEELTSSALGVFVVSLETAEEPKKEKPEKKPEKKTANKSGKKPKTNTIKVKK